jgi:hypothetical protein
LGGRRGHAEREEGRPSQRESTNPEAEARHRRWPGAAKPAAITPRLALLESNSLP